MAVLVSIAFQQALVSKVTCNGFEIQVMKEQVPQACSRTPTSTDRRPGPWPRPGGGAVRPRPPSIGPH